jgi:uncharacterized protein (DUF2267 family)
MKPLDTSDAAWQHQVQRWRSMSGPERAEAAFRLRRRVLSVFRDGIRARHPDYSEQQVHLVVMRRILGDELYQRVFPGEPVLEP